MSGPRRWMKSQDKADFLYDTGNVKPDGTVVPPFSRWTHMHECLIAAAQSDEVDTIIVDSLTAIQEYVKDDIFRQRTGAQKMGGGAQVMITEQNRDRGQLTEPEWGIFARYFMTLVTTLRTFPKLVVFAAHSESRQKGDHGPWEETLSLQGAMRYKLSAQFSDCIELVTKTEGGFGNTPLTVSRSFRTLPATEIDKRGLKSSFDLPPVFTDPQTLFKQLNENMH